MATVNPTWERPNQRDDLILYTWTLTTANADGAKIEMAQWADRCFTATGTWGGATLTIQGSNDGTNWLTLNLASTGTATASTDKAMQILELPRYIRPNLTTPGVGATVTVMALLRRNHPLRA
jgi:hypothetical protein